MSSNRVVKRFAKAAEWTANNDILDFFELGIENDTSPKKIKIGDGFTQWNDLPYVTFGSVGGGSGTSSIWNETPTGTIDGYNKVFTSSVDFASGTTRLTLNGLRLTLGVHYTESGPNEITFDDAPEIGDDIILDFDISLI